jgi:hypothetical protein
MAVTVYWVEFNAGYGDGSTGTALAQSLNFGSVDLANLTPASYPIAAGSNGFAKYIKIHFSGSYTQISNAKLWKSNGAYKTGEAIKFSGNYVKGTGAPTATALPAVSGKAVPDIAVASPGSANVCLPDLTTDILKQSEHESSPGYASGAYSSMMAFQLQTTSSAPAGPVNTKTISLTYDRQ